MSHIVQIETEVRDFAVAKSACDRLKLAEPQLGTHRLFSGQEGGLGVQFPGWRYPAVFDLTSGKAKFDNFEGRWGDHSHLGRFLQGYAVEMATIEARKQGHTVTEQPLPDGSIKLTVLVAGCRT